MSDSEFSDFEEEREATLARNREILAKLELTNPVLSLPSKAKAKPQTTQREHKAKPIQPTKKRGRREDAPAAPTRQSARLQKGPANPDETPAQKRKREQEEEERRKKLEDEKLEAEERAREAKRPRHNELDLSTLSPDADSAELASLRATLAEVLQVARPRRIGEVDAYVFDGDSKGEEREVKDLKEKLQGMKIVARAKVTEDRIYSAAYHPEPTKDLIFFGDKHGQLGIWDARAPSEEVADEDGDVTSDDKEGGRYWRLQCHWPATSKSSISTVKFDPLDSHSVFTSAYDCTIRSLSFVSGISQEVFTTEEALISCIDVVPTGHEMWVADAVGGLTHLDLRESRGKAKWYGVSNQKVGSVSINPTSPHFLVTASNSRLLRVWDTRKFHGIPVDVLDHDSKSDAVACSNEVVEEYAASTKGKGTLRAEWRHNKSASSAYWDPRGRSIVSTSYDDTIRLWEISPSVLKKDGPFPSSRPLSQIKHNCQTGKWLTILKAQWTPNPDVYPHFTIGNMEHQLDIFSCKGDLLARLYDRSKITAVQAVTCSHPSIVERAASGNASGRCVLWAPADQ